MIERRLLAALVPVLLAASSTVYAREEPFPTRAGVFGLRIESNKTAYRLGEPIRLRVTLRNNTDEHLAVIGAPPAGLCDLRILDGRGRPLPRVGARQTKLPRDGVGAIDFPARKSMVLWWADPAKHLAIEQWVDVASWGYDIDRPGSYTITAFPTLDAFVRSEQNSGIGASFTTSQGDASNRLRISVEK
jgi:hypothetical protein